MTLMTTEPVLSVKTLHFTTVGGHLLQHRIAEIEALALSSLQSGKSLDRTVTGALASLRAACDGARVCVGDE